MKFYEIAEQIAQCVDEETGEVNVERLNELIAERDKKIESLALYTISLAADEAALGEEIARLQKRKKSIANKRQSIRDFLAANLNGEKFKSPMVTVSYSTRSVFVVDDETKIPKKYKTLVKTYELDEDLIKADIQMNGSVRGCHIDKKTSLTIR